MSKYKDDIIRLRKQGKSYREIEEKLGCSRGNISYHCKQEGLDDIGKKNKELSDEKKQKVKKLRKENTISQVSKKLGIAESTVVKYSDGKKQSGGHQTKQVSLTERQRLGALAEANVKARYTELGYTVLVPEVTKAYDIVVEKNSDFERVQIKYGRYKNGAVRADLTWGSINSNGRSSYGYSEKDIDKFAVWNDETEEVYTLSCGPEAPKSIAFRVEEAKNGQTKGIRFAENFRL